MAVYIGSATSSPSIATTEMDATCAYNTMHDCFQPRIDGYEYCNQHILEDRSAPYRQCSYAYPTNGRRCINATHKKESGGLCEEHSRQAQLVRQAAGKRHKPPMTPESLLVSLAHYAKIEKKSVNSSFETNANESSTSLDPTKADIVLNAESLEGSEEPEIAKVLDPFVEIDAFRVNSSMSRVMDYASESESDPEPITIHSRGDISDSGSEYEGIDEKDDILRHAGIYSAEEVTMITKEKLIRLQSLYIEQFRRLQHSLRERRRTYLQALKKEKETMSSIHNQPRETAKEQKLYNKLKALNRYHKRNGVEAVLHKKALERRAMATEGVNVRPAPTVKCIFTEGGVKCGEKTLPVSKYCKKHILNDNHQSLFRPCGAVRGGFECNEPVVNIFKSSFCVYHTNIPTVRTVKEDVIVKSECSLPSTIVKPAAPEDDISSSKELLAVLENSDTDTSVMPMEVEKPSNSQVDVDSATEFANDTIESKLSALFGDSEATDTSSEKGASEKEQMNNSQNLDDV